MMPATVVGNRHLLAGAPAAAREDARPPAAAVVGRPPYRRWCYGVAKADFLMRRMTAGDGDIGDDGDDGDGKRQECRFPEQGSFTGR